MKTILVLITLLLNVILVYCQYNDDTSKTYVTRITSYSNVWGLLKYYHPNIKKNKISFNEWEKVFIENSEEIINSQSIENLNNIIYKTLNLPGEIKKTSKQQNDSLLKLKIFSWIEKDVLISESNKQLLYYIIINSYKTKHKQIKKEKLHGYKLTKYITETDYSYIKYNNFALMGTITFLQELKYFYPYEELQNMSINDLYEKYIPQTFSCKNRTDYRHILSRISSEINDSHAAYHHYSKRKLGIYLSSVEDTVFVFSNKTKLERIKKGDILVSINDQSIKSVTDSLNQYISASTPQAKTLRIPSLLLFNDKVCKQKLKFLDSDNTEYEVIADAFTDNLPNTTSEEIKAVMKRYRDSSYYKINTNIGYINTCFLENNQTRKSFRYLKNTKGLIIDLRNYKPYGRLPNYHQFIKFISNKKGKYIDVNFNSNKRLGFFMKKGIFSIYEKIRPLSFKSNTYLFKKYFKNKKIIVLINENTISYYEMFAMAIKFCRPDAIFIGRTTNGTVGNSTTIKVPGDVFINLSTVKCYTNKGEKIQGKGIIPDVIVQKSINQIINDIDPVKVKAINIIENED